MNRIFQYSLLTLSLILSSCFKEIDTVSIPRTVDKTFTVEQSIKSTQSYYRFYENTVLEVQDVSAFGWDLAFESAGEGSRVLQGWSGSSRIIATGKYELSEITQDLIIDLIENSDEWTFDDPSYINVPDSLSLTYWEDGEVFIQKRGSATDTYYAFQFVSRNEESYTIHYASATALDSINEGIIYRSSGFNYVYFSYPENAVVPIEPLSTEWDIVCTPYSGWWLSATSGETLPYYVSGILINNENGVRIVEIDDPDIEYADIDEMTIDTLEFTDFKGTIGSDWKVLGAVGSPDLYTMDPDKKWVLKKYDFETDRELYFKLQIVDYKLDGEDHHPTIEFTFLKEN